MSLPSGYTQLEYIESSGTQYIDTGVSATNSIGFEIDFETTSPISTTDFGTIFGCLNSGSNRYNLGTYPDKSGGQFTFGSNVYNPYLSTSKRLLLSLRGTKLATPNDVQTVSGTFSVGTTITVFARKRVDGTIDEYSKTKLYYLKLYSSTTVVRDFRPARRDSDNAVGLYDLQNGVFYANSGTGSFTAGPVALYTELSYIEATGTQCINTRYKPNSTTHVAADLQMLAESTTESQWLFCGRDSSSSGQFGLYLYTNKAFYAAYGTEQSKFTGPAALDRHLCDYAQNVVDLSGTSVTLTAQTFQSNTELYVFARNNAGTISQYAKMRLYSFKLYDNGTLVRDFVPARRNSDGAIGLLDQANNVFYANAGTGTFTAGPVAEYTWLEYIESDGNQYIDTLYKPNNNTRVEMDVELTDTGTYPTPFGAWNSGSSAMFIFLCFSGLAKTRLFYGASSNDITIDVSGRIKIDANKTTWSVDGTTATTFSSATFQTSYSMYLWGYNNAGTRGNVTAGKIYSCKIYDNDTLVRNFIPAKRSDGTVGLYDAVNAIFYTNSGTGSFTAGPEIVESVSLSVAAVDGASVVLKSAIACVEGVETPIAYALANIDGIEVTIPFSSTLGGDITVTIIVPAINLWSVEVNGTEYKYGTTGAGTFEESLQAGDVVTVDMTNMSYGQTAILLNGEAIDKVDSYNILAAARELAVYGELTIDLGSSSTVTGSDGNAYVEPCVIEGDAETI